MADKHFAKTIELNDGTRMPLLGLGTWEPSALPHSTVQGAVETAIAAGYRHIDSAYSFQNEADVGKALKSKMNQGVIKRQDMFIASKLWGTHHAPEDIPICLNKSLTDLQLEYLDLYLIHFPVGLQKVGDELKPMKNGQILTSDVDYVDVWKGMEALQASGKVKSIGVSNFSILQLERLLSKCRVPPAVNQVELHPYMAQTSMIEFCQSKNIALTAFSPFGSPGRPSEMLNGDGDPHRILKDSVVAEIAKKHKRSPAQVLLRYHVQQSVAVTPKSNKSHHILENTKIFNFALTEDDMGALTGLDQGWKCFTSDENLRRERFFRPQVGVLSSQDEFLDEEYCFHRHLILWGDYVSRTFVHSINVQVICDAGHRIPNVEATWPGSVQDSRIFRESMLSDRFASDDGYDGFLLGDRGHS